MRIKISNRRGSDNSLQVSYIGDIPSGSFTFDDGFLIKNITTEAITCKIKPIGMNEFITTVVTAYNNLITKLTESGLIVSQLET